MKHHPFHILSRRSFLDKSLTASLGIGLTSLLGVPPFVRRALAQGDLGANGKKVLFIFLRGANDALNSVIPVEDPAYYNMGTQASPIPTRPDISIAKDPLADYTLRGACFDATAMKDVAGTPRTSSDPTFSYTSAIPLGNGFAGLHPSLKFLAPVYNSGALCMVHRVGYPKQSRSHFDSQNFWETGAPYSSNVRDGIFYRAIIESGLANSAPLTGVSVQRTLPVLLRGTDAAMTNLTDTDRYSLLGLPSITGRDKSAAFLKELNGHAAPERMSREMLRLQYENLANTLDIFGGLRSSFQETGNTFRDDVATDGDAEWYTANGNQGYYLFPTTAEINGGWRRPGGGTSPAKYVVPQNNTSSEFFTNLKAAALILNNTDAIVAGTQLDGFDTHSNQGALTGRHPDLAKTVGWSMYALQKYFTRYANKVDWKNVVVVTLTEFGRTTVQNSDEGTDHAEAGVMWVAGGSVKGFDGTRSGVHGCHPNDRVRWIPGPANQAGGDGSMFGVSNRYLKRAFDYRSILGEVIRNHLGATSAQLKRIIPGYAIASEKLEGGGLSSVDGTDIMGEAKIL